VFDSGSFGLFLASQGAQQEKAASHVPLSVGKQTRTRSSTKFLNLKTFSERRVVLIAEKMNFEGFQDLIRRVAVEWYKAAKKEIIEMELVITYMITSNYNSRNYIITSLQGISLLAQSAH
jgi:hypothetical protein